MVEEKVTVVWRDNFSFTWSIHYKGLKSIKSARDGKRLLNLLKARGDPIQVLGDGRYAELMRKEYNLYKINPKEYQGIPFKETVSIGSQLIGVPVEKISKTLKRLKIN